LDESLNQNNEKEKDLSDSFSEGTTECSSASPIETIKESGDLSELLKHQLQQDQAEIARLKDQSRVLRENLEKIELENEELKSRRFCFENMTEDNSISFYTAFPNILKSR